MPSTSSPSPEPDRPVSAVEAPAPGAPRPREADRASALPRGLLVLPSAAGVVVAVAGLRSAAGLVGPAFMALMIVITIHPLLAWLQRHRVPGWLAVGLTMLVAYAALLALAAALVLSVARLATLIPSYQPQFTSLVDQVTDRLGELGVTQEQINTAVSQFDLNSLVGVLQRVLTGVAGVVSDLAFILVLLSFLIIDSSSFPRRLAAAAAQRPQLVEALTSFASATREYAVVSTVFGLIVAHSVINFVIQSLFQPKFVGDAVGLSVTLTFLSLVFWTFVIGPLGALLAVPLSLFAKVLLVDADPDSRWLDPLIAPNQQGDGEGSGRA
jgi:AI-2 transport protein TqsA